MKNLSDFGKKWALKRTATILTAAISERSASAWARKVLTHCVETRPRRKSDFQKNHGFWPLDLPRVNFNSEKRHLRLITRHSLFKKEFIMKAAFKADSAANQALLTPIKIGTMTLPNRVFMAPLTRSRSTAP